MKIFYVNKFWSGGAQITSKPVITGGMSGQFFHDHPHQRLQKVSLLQPLSKNYPLASYEGVHSLIAFPAGQKKEENLPLIFFLRCNHVLD